MSRKIIFANRARRQFANLSDSSLIFEHRNAVYTKANEQRSTKNQRNSAKLVVLTTGSALRWIFLMLIGLYRTCLSPFLGNHCRFYPSCSEYAHDALTTQPFFKAIYLIMRRLLRCNPFCKGGVDVV